MGGPRRLARGQLGIPGVFLLKSVILVFVALVALQGVALALHSALRLAGLEAADGAAPTRASRACERPRRVARPADVLALCGLILLGFPVAFSLAGTALFFACSAMRSASSTARFSAFLPNRIFAVMINEVLIAVPLFVFMGMMLERSKVAEDLLETMGQLFGNLRGGLGVSVSVVGALLAASTGIVGATVMAMGLISLPVMLRRGYDPALACG